jgi:predicted ATPase
MLTSLEFESFRGFKHLKLEGLSRVNLIVGKNNVGKTSLMEGIALLAKPSQLRRLPELLRNANSNPAQHYYRWLISDKHGVSHLMETLESGEQRIIELSLAHDPNRRDPTTKTPYEVSSSEGGVYVVRLKRSPEMEFVTISTGSRNDLTPQSIVKSFAKAVLRRSGEETIESVLNKVDPRIQKVRVDASTGENILVVDFGLSQLIPLSQAGQGIARIVEILSTIIGNDASLCLIDEIENGIHHSSLEQVWSGIAKASKLLNVQVFATTHSYECIAAAHAAFSMQDEYDFRVVQLFRVETDLQGRVLDRPLIEAALAGDIDLRGV